MNAMDPRERRPLGTLAAWCARRRITVLGITMAAMLVLGGGMLLLTFEDDPLKAMPTGDPHTLAGERLVENFPSNSYVAAVFVNTSPPKWEATETQLSNRLPFPTEAASGQEQFYDALNDLLGQGSQDNFDGFAQAYPGPDNITDEVYIRGMEELIGFIQDRIPDMAWAITLPSQVKLINYTNTGIPEVRAPQASAFSMPDTSPQGAQQFNTAWQTYWVASLDSIKSITSPDFKSTRLALIFNPDPETTSLSDIGQQVYDAVAEYQDAVRTCDEGGECVLQWNVFEAEEVVVDPRAPVTVASYLTKTSLEDVVRLSPFVALFIGTTLFIAFRRPGVVAAMMMPMGLAGIGVLGIFGFIGLPIHSVSLLVFPVLMGNGIDFAIHMANGYHTARLRGADVHTAAYHAGESAGTPLFVATMTTLAGMLLLVFAPNKMLSQLGLAILLGMALLLLVSLTALPAALSYTKSAETRHSWLGRALYRNARFWNRNKTLGGILVVALVAGSILGVGQLQSLIIGTPAAFFPEGDPQRDDFEYSNDVYFLGNIDQVSNVLVLEGDLVDPASMEFMHVLEDKMRALDFIRDESVSSPYFALNAWIQVRQGTAGAPLVIAQESLEPGATFPTDRDGIKALADEMYDTPLATYISFFLAQPDYTIGSLLIDFQQSADFKGLEEQWNTLYAAVVQAKAEVPDADVDVHIAGATAISYLFTKEELPYLQVASFIGLAFTGFLVLAIRRRARDAVTVAAVVGAAGLWWVGGLAVLDIPLTIALVVPVVMIAAIGSDYALHMRYGLADGGEHAWSTVGRAVFYSAMTDLGAFLIFTRMRYGLLQDATVATVLALAASLVATLILVPMLTSERDLENTPVADA